MSGTLQPGSVFAGRFRVVRLLAAGGMGAVYEVVHLETERRRALKVMHPHILQNDEMRGRFKLEAKVAAHIESDFIVDVFDAGIDDRTQMPFLVMELLRGEDLERRVARLGPLPAEEAVLHLHQAALALDKTHKASIIHRDLKPENLFLAEREDSPPRIKVLDFGIAKIVAESTTQGGTTETLGSPLYMAPEQFDASSRLSSAVDIHAIGMIAYTLLVGVSYWWEEKQAGNVFAVAVAVMHGPPQPASVRAAAHGVTLPPAFDAWFATATAVDPGARFPTALAAVRALAEALEVPLPVTASAPAEGVPSSRAHSSARPSAGGLAAGFVPGRSAPPFAGREALAASSAGTSPETTARGTAVTQPVGQGRGGRGAVAAGLALVALGALGGVFYQVRFAAQASPATPGDAAAAPKPSVSTAPADPALALSSLDAGASSGPFAPERASPEGDHDPSPIRQAPGASASASAAPTPRAPAPPPRKKKYTQE